jgi:hypothetical protein
MNKHLLISLFTLIIATSLVACDALKVQNAVPKAAPPDPSTQNTLVALSVMQTELVAPSPTATEPATATPTETLTPSATNTLPATNTSTPIPTDTSTASATPTPVPSDTPTPTPGLEDKIKGANILVYEDLGTTNLVPRISQAIELLKLSGGKVVNTHANLPSFVSYLKGPTAWDAVVIAVESRDTLNLSSLGVYNLIQRHVENGGALVVEYWNMNRDSSDLSSFIEDKCAIRSEKDWVRKDGYNYADYALYDLNQGVHIFDSPFKINLPMLPNVYWSGVVGDLMSKMPKSKALFATGLSSSDSTRYGLITSCNDGRLLLQTFSTHDYRLFETTELWANYLHYVLSNHFNPPVK